MSYKVLYRKYRPTTFDKIVGQQAIVNNLKSSVLENTFSHAYIFTGPRGTGKTSTAKVLAKALTCTDNQNGEPCGQCTNCQNFATSPDIIEIDAASNNGVNEIRELRNNITLAPAESKYKIYIIDEVHMLTTGAFNALLKTLEEPPAHAIFILATTEVYKVPITILSRCQRYDFKKIAQKDMIEHLKYVCGQENIDYEEGVLEEIYELSEGCLRDALSILDQTSKTKNTITVDTVLKDYNMISNRAVKELLEAMKNSDIKDIINKIESYEKSGINAQKLIKRMISYLERTAIEIKLGKNDEFSYRTIATLIESLNRCYIDARINENVFTIIKLCFLENIGTDSIDQNKPLEKETIKTSEPKRDYKERPSLEEDTKKNSSSTQEKMTLTDIRVNNCFVEATKNALKNVTDIWSKIDDSKIKSIDTREYTPVASSETYTIFTAEESSLADLFNIKRKEIEKELRKSIKEIKVVALSTNEWKEKKERYIHNLKNNKKYTYIEEPKETEDDSKVKKEAEDLFTEKLVEIS